MIQKIEVVGPFQCNCIILGCEETKEAVVIDPGDEPQKILSAIQAGGWKVKYLLHTHGHLDHIAATKKVHQAAQGTICIHRDDEFIYNQLPMQARMFGLDYEATTPVQKYLEDGEVLEFGKERMEVRHTPGHSPGSIGLRLLGSQERLFAGDTLFAGSIGRTDLWGGDMDLLLKSVRERLFVLEDDVPVFPGHGPQTRIGFEKKNNPFFQ